MTGEAHRGRRDGGRRERAAVRISMGEGKREAGGHPLPPKTRTEQTGSALGAEIPGGRGRRSEEQSLPRRWVTGAGSITAEQLERSCARAGVRLDRSRRTYWQTERVFPQPERRNLRPPDGRRGARGFYHPGAVDLARLIDYVVTPDHPAKHGRWRYPVRDLALRIATWREECSWAGADAEEAFYARVAGLMPLVESGGPVPGLKPLHRDVLPGVADRVAGGRRSDTMETIGRVAQAIADSWVEQHPETPPPERLVVWFRLRRRGAEGWLVAASGARRDHRAGPS